jgi:mannose-6-phosphate isomerase-like protein (cupin superfamily)
LAPYCNQVSLEQHALFVSLGTLVLTQISRVRLIQLKTNIDARGRLTAIEGESDLPFAIQRLFYVYDVSPGGERAAHAHPDTEQCLIAVSGALDVDVMSPEEQKHFRLDDPGIGLYVPPMLWVRLANFTPGAVCFAAASTHYVPEHVIRDWGEYVGRAGAAGRPVQ